MKKAITKLLCFLLILTVQQSFAQNCSVNAGVATNYCPGQPMKLYGGIAGLSNPSTVLWTQISGPAVTISNPNNLTTNCGVAASGATYVFRLSCQCQDGATSTNDVTYTGLVAPPTPPVADAGADINVNCVKYGDPFTIPLNATPAPPGFRGEWRIKGAGYGTFGNVYDPNAIFTPTQRVVGDPFWDCPTNTAYEFYWILVSTINAPAQCPDLRVESRDSVIATVSMYNPIDARIVTPGCGNPTNQIRLYGTCTGASTVNWTLVSGPVGYTYTGASTRDVIINNPPTGSYTFRYTVNVGTPNCVSGFKDVTAYVDAGANYFVTGSNANAGLITRGFCDTIPASLQLAANNVNVGETGTWSQLRGAPVTFTNANDPNTAVNGLSNSGSPYLFKWTITNALGCSNFDTVSIVKISFDNPLPLTFTSNCVLTTRQTSVSGPGPIDQYISPKSCTAIPTYTFISDPNLLFGSSTGVPRGQGWYMKGMTLTGKPLGATDTYGYKAATVTAGVAGRDPKGRLADCVGKGFEIVTSQDFFTGNTNNDANIGIYVAHYAPFIQGSYTGVLHFVNSLCGREIEVPFTFNLSYNSSNSNAGTDQNLACNVTSTNLSGNDPTLTTPFYGVGVWEQVSGPNTANIVNKNDKGSLVNNLVQGTYIFRWRIQGGAFCPPQQDEVQIKVSTGTISASAGTNRTVCHSTPVTLTATNSFGVSMPTFLTNNSATGTWTKTSGPAGAVITNPNNFTTTVTGLIASSVYVFTYTVTNACGSQASNVTITTNATAGPSAAVTSGGGCTQVSPLLLNATPPTVGTGVWSQVGATPNLLTITPTNNPNTSVTGFLPNSVYKLIYTVTVAGCTPSVDTEYVSRTSFVNGFAGPDLNVCVNIGVDTFHLNAVPVTAGIGTWTQFSGPPGAVFANPNSPTTKVTVLSDGQYIFRFTGSDGAGVCSGSADDVVVNFYRRPVLAQIFTVDTALCSNSNGQLTLNAASVAPGSGTWAAISNNPAVITSPTNPTTAATVLPGTTTFRWSSPSTNGVCPSSSDDVIVKYIPAANAGADIALCKATSAILKSSTPGAGTGTWSVISQPAASPSVTFTPQGNFETHSANPLVAGTYTFRWTVTDVTCGTSFDDVNVVIDDAPNPNAGVDVCDTVGTTIALNGLAIPVGVSALWSRVSAPVGASAGTFSPIGTESTSYSTPNVAGTYNFQYQFTKGACQIKDYVQIRAITNASAGTNIVQCNNGTFTLNGTALATGETGTWTKLNGGDPGAITNINLRNSTVTGLNPGDSINLIWTASTVEGCIKADTVALVNKANTIAAGSAAASYCDNIIGLDLVGNAPAPGTGSWSMVSAPAGAPALAWTNQNTQNAKVKGLTIGTYVFRYTIDNLPCIQSTNDVTINSTCTALPVIIENFVAQPKNSTEVLLQWEVSAQVNIHNYTVEHSTDGRTFTSFAVIDANNYTSYKYATIHTTPIIGINYYRVKITENYGSVSYTDIRKVKMTKQGSMVDVYPLPAKNLINITFATTMIGKPATINIISVDGQVVLRKQLGTINQTEELDIKGLIPGNYIMQIITAAELINKKIEVIK